MHQRGVYLFCILALLYSAAAAWWPVTVPKYPTGDHCSDGNSEALYACGRPIRLSVIEQFDLELIPGMNAELAESILRQREEILEDRSRHRIKERALEVVHGIGRARARKFGRYLIVD